MASTNKTTNLELSQFLGTDKPSWLNDYNADMLAIDTAVGTNVTDISTAQSRADSAYTLADNTASSVSTLSTQVSSNTTDIATAKGNITTINSLIGNGTPTTTDQTIIGAINELVDGSKYETIASVTGDGTKTAAQLLSSLYSQLSSYLSDIDLNPANYVLYEGTAVCAYLTEPASAFLTFTQCASTNTLWFSRSYKLGDLSTSAYTMVEINSGGSSFSNNTSTTPTATYAIAHRIY